MQSLELIAHPAVDRLTLQIERFTEQLDDDCLEERIKNGLKLIKIDSELR